MILGRRSPMLDLIACLLLCFLPLLATAYGGGGGASSASVSPRPAQSPLSPAGFPDCRLWATSVGYGLPDCEGCAAAHYGELYPLTLRENASSPPQGEPDIARMVDAGISGLQRLVLSSAGVPAGAWMRGTLTQADVHPGFIVVPELSVQSGLSTEQRRATALAMVESYATEARTHSSAGRIGDRLIIATYAAHTLTPDDWQWVRDEAAAEGIATYWLADVNASFSQHSTFPAALITPYFPVFESFYLFDDQTKYDADLQALMRAYNRPFAGGFMPGYDRETTTTGGYVNAEGTGRMRRQFEAGLDAGLAWQTVNTWDDVVERTEIEPSSDWNWTRTDISAFYAARIRGTFFPNAQPQLYITTPQYIRLGEAPQAEALVLNPSGNAVRVSVVIKDGSGLPYGLDGSSAVATIDSGTSAAATTSSTETVQSFPSGRFLRAYAEMTDTAGHVLQTVTSAPVLVYAADDPNVAVVSFNPTHPTRRTYYSIPAARALPGPVRLHLSASPVSLPTQATATVTPPTNDLKIRFVEVLQNARQVKNLFARPPYEVRLPMGVDKIVGGEQVAPTASGFYVARVIDQQERVGYSDPIYVGPDDSVGESSRSRSHQ